MKKILDHKLVKIIDAEKEFRVLIQMSEGGWLEHNPFPHDLRGMVAALQLATDVVAGKFYPMRAARIEQATLKSLEYQENDQ